MKEACFSLNCISLSVLASPGEVLVSAAPKDGLRSCSYGAESRDGKMAPEILTTCETPSSAPSMAYSPLALQGVFM